jgi:hypothetical protein
MMVFDASLLRWIQVSPADLWSDLLPVPYVNQGFTELKRVLFRKPGADWAFFVDDEKLRDDPENPDCWTWSPNFFAGEVTGELRGPSGGSTLFLLDVAPDPSKFGREAFRQMVDEILNEQPELLFGSEPATIQVGELGVTQNPWLEFARLRRYVPAFVQALSPIHVKPRLTLRVRRESLPLHRVRRVDRRTALSMARTPAVVLKEGADVRVPVLRPDVELDVPSVEETVDSAANRTLGALLNSLIHRTASITARLQMLVANEPSSETRSAVAERWPERRRVLDDLALRLERARRRSPFCLIRGAEITSSGLTAIAADPIYARAWGQGWRALRPGVDGETGTDRLWVSPSWEIYESWCFVRMSRALREHSNKWEWERTSKGKDWVGRLGARRAVLSFQPTFSSFASDSIRRSISAQRIPDLMFSVESERGIRFMLIDAKYRTSTKNVLDAMSSAHIYQDSLRIGNSRPEASLLFVPRGGGATWLEEIEFQVAHRVGVCVFSTEAPADVPLMIRTILDDFES